MKYKVKRLGNLNIGHLYENAEYIAFFGNKHASEAGLAQAFPALKFRFLKQIHGKKIVRSEDKTLEADAHWTNESGIALCVKTADCLPVLIANSKCVVAIHAGWRGVATQIIPESIKLLSLPAAEFLIGPHIGFNSFEVGLDVANLILASVAHLKAKDGSFQKPSHNRDKCYINLLDIAKAQISHLDPGATIDSLDIDTYLDQDLASFRRDKTMGRQFSFIAIK